MATWIMSNRQPWTEMVVKGHIRTKTRNATSIASGDIVFLHASKALWQGWQNLAFFADMPMGEEWDVKKLPRGGVYGVGLVERVGITPHTMPPEDYEKFTMYDTDDFDDYQSPELDWNCAMYMSIVFSKVIELPFVACRGVQQPARKLPEELQKAISPVNSSGIAREYCLALDQLKSLSESVL